MTEPVPLNRTRDLWIEITVVLIGFTLPSIVNSFASLYLSSGPSRTPFLYTTTTSTARHLGLFCVLLFIIWRSPDSFASFGIKRFRIPRDLLGGIALAAILLGTALLYRSMLHAMFTRAFISAHSRPSSYVPPHGSAEFLFDIVSQFANGFYEELLVRAYLITRLEKLLDSTSTALLLTTAIFAAYHTYQGNLSAVRIIVHGLIYGLWFIRSRSLAPVAIAHSLYDLLLLFTY